MNERQIQHETNMSRAGTEKVQRELRDLQNKKYASKSGFGRDFIIAFCYPLADALLEATKKTARGRGVRTALARGYRDMQSVFTFMQPKVVSYIALTTLVDQYYVAKHYLPKTQDAARIIGSKIEDELSVQYFTELAPPEVVSAMNKQINTPGSSPTFRRSGAKYTAEKLLMHVHGWSKEDLFIDWGTHNRFNVGVFVLEVAASLGLIEYFTEQIPHSKKKQGHYRLSEPVLVQERKYQDKVERNKVIYEPLYVQPREWELQDGPARNNISGGYYQEWIKRDLGLCRGYTSNTTLGTDAINLLNTLGKTAWNIDRRIYEIARQCYEESIPDVGKLKVVFHHPMIDARMPQHIVDKGDKHPEFKEWKEEKSKYIELHRQSINKARATASSLVIAEKYKKDPRFYLSWSCDYRGRMYPQQPLLDQQKGDFQRSLVYFSDGCKLDDEGQRYAAEALGAAYKGSKISYEERSRWTYDNDLIIKAIAEDPIAMSSHWEGADEPWQFLQLAKEWTDVVLDKSKKLWTVPIGADATASGLQLLSAMRRDPKGMKFTNLMASKGASEGPQDAYKQVLKEARKMVYRNPETEWLTEHLEDRKLGKAVLMTKVYGSSYLTNYSDIQDILIEQGKYPDIINKQALSQITKILSDASREVFPLAFEALTWIKSLMPKDDKDGRVLFNWTTPNLDTINLNKIDYKPERITSKFVGRISIPTDEVDGIDYAGMRSSIAPDFVHSYDACVLKTAFQDWNHPLAVIHDCIKVLPNDMDRAKDRIRKAFVYVCSGDPLARLADDLGIPEHKKKRLPQGEGDLEAVLDADYMFN